MNRLGAAVWQAKRAHARRRGEDAPTSGGGFERYRDDPVAFAIEVLGITPWSRQAEFLRAVAANDRVAVKAGHKLSKSCTLAILSLWFVLTRPGARVIFTNSSARQVRTVNFRELRMMFRRIADRIGDDAELNDVPDRGLQFTDGREILGFTTDEPDRWGGISGGDLLFIVDEASGVPESIFEAIDGNLAGDNAKLVLAGNPLRPSGRFYEVFTSRTGWTLLTISSIESPNIQEGREVIRGLASCKWRQQMEDDYGLESPLYQTRVLGEFATQSEYSVIGLADVNAAVARSETADFNNAGPLVLGVDAARFGDDESVIVVRRGYVTLPPVTLRNADGPTLAAKVAEVATQYKRTGERPRVRIDVIGIGSSPYDALKAYEWLDAEPINVAESPTINDHYALLRDQLWFEMGKWIKAGGCIANDRKLHGELCAPVYTFDMRGNRKVESKADLKKKIKRSPDRADALALAVMDDARLEPMASFGHEDWQTEWRGQRRAF